MICNQSSLNLKFSLQHVLKKTNKIAQVVLPQLLQSEYMAFSGEDSTTSDFDAAVQTTLYIILLLVAILGNGLLFSLFVCNKPLQTVHRALLVELSIVDLLHSAINIPLSICYVIHDIPISRGKTFAWTASFLHSLFALLSLSSMALQMIDRYLAVCWPIFYKTRKSMPKIITIITAKWLLILTTVLLVYIPLYDADLGNSSVLEYRTLYAKRSGQKLPQIAVPVLVFTTLLFGSLSLWTLRTRPDEIAGEVQNNSPSARARKKAVYTILMLLTITLISYLPPVIKSRAWLELQNGAKIWLVFVVMFPLSVPSAVNPFIVLLRVKCFADKLEALTNRLKSICRKHQAQVENVSGSDVKNDRETVGGNFFRADRFKLRTIYRHDSCNISRSISCPNLFINTKESNGIRKSSF